MTDTQEMIQRASEVKKRHEDALMRLPGVVGVGVGLRRRDRFYTDEVAIVVMVTRKLPPNALPPAEVLPREIEGIPVDVVESGTLTAE